MSPDFEVESERPGGGPEVTTVTMMYGDERPDLKAFMYEGAERFSYGFSWEVEGLRAEDVRSMLESDEKVSNSSIPHPVSTAGINAVRRDNEKMGIDYSDERYRVLSNGFPADMLSSHYSETTGQHVPDIESDLELLQQKILDKF